MPRPSSTRAQRMQLIRTIAADRVLKSMDSPRSLIPELKKHFAKREKWERSRNPDRYSMSKYNEISRRALLDTFRFFGIFGRKERSTIGPILLEMEFMISTSKFRARMEVGGMSEAYRKANLKERLEEKFNELEKIISRDQARKMLSVLQIFREKYATWENEN